MTKSPRKNVPDVGFELGAACMPSELASDRATALGLTHFEPGQLVGGAKTRDPREKTPDHPQAEQGLSHMWPELGLNPQWWVRALKISGLNHSTTGAAMEIIITKTQFYFYLYVILKVHIIYMCVLYLFSLHN